jgi:hypothetical protein
MKKFVSMLILLLTMVAGAAFVAQARNPDRNDRGHDKVVRVVRRPYGGTMIRPYGMGGIVRHRRHHRRFYGPTIVRRIP